MSGSGSRSTAGKHHCEVLSKDTIPEFTGKPSNSFQKDEKAAYYDCKTSGGYAGVPGEKLTFPNARSLPPSLGEAQAKCVNSRTVPRPLPAEKKVHQISEEHTPEERLSMSDSETRSAAAKYHCEVLSKDTLPESTGKLSNSLQKNEKVRSLPPSDAKAFRQPLAPSSDKETFKQENSTSDFQVGFSVETLGEAHAKRGNSRTVPLPLPAAKSALKQEISGSDFQVGVSAQTPCKAHANLQRENLRSPSPCDAKQRSDFQVGFSAQAVGEVFAMLQHGRSRSPLPCPLKITPSGEMSRKDLQPRTSDSPKLVKESLQKTKVPESRQSAKAFKAKLVEKHGHLTTKLPRGRANSDSANSNESHSARSSSRSTTDPSSPLLRSPKTRSPKTPTKKSYVMERMGYTPSDISHLDM